MKGRFQDLLDPDHELLDNSHCQEARREQSEDHNSVTDFHQKNIT